MKLFKQISSRRLQSSRSADSRKETTLSTGDTTPPTSPEPYRRRRLRVVSFGDSITSPIPKRSAYTKAERKSLWYSSKELHTLRKSVDKVLQDESELDESQDCWRGLEYWKAQQQRDESGEELQSKVVMLHLMQASRDNQNKKKKKNRGEGELSLDDCKDLESLGKYLNGDAIRSASQRAAQDLVEAYSIYLETMEVEEVDSSFHLDDSHSRAAEGPTRHGENSRRRIEIEV